MTQTTAYFPTVGGLDLVTPPISRKPGFAIGGKNYEPRPEGYRRIAGFERYDGRALASVASYWVLEFDAGTAAIAEGETVTGATSGATGKALIAGVVESGAYGTSDAVGYLVLTTITGAFQDNENLQVSAATKCVANGTATQRGALTDTNDTMWLRDAIETQRALIAAVPGSGAIRGVWSYGGSVYAFRDNAGATACVMHKATAAGWVAQALGGRVRFVTGTSAIAEGQTVTGATSGATGVVTRVVVREGDWTGGNEAEGQLIFATISGTFSNGENLQVGGATKAVANGASAAIALLPGGRFEFANYNFTGLAGAARMYGCDGVNPAFEWDGAVLAPILTGMTADTPRHIAAHANYLFLSFDASVQFSGLGDPYAWSVLTGAGELSIGETVTGMVAGYAGALSIFGRNRVGVLYGTVMTGADSDGVLKIITEEAGAVEWSVQAMGQPIFLDDRGVRNLASVQEFGDFQAGTLSKLLKPLLDDKKASGLTVTASLRVRDLNQYRLFWSDGAGIVMDMSGDRVAFMPLDLGMVIRCAASVEDSDGNERLYAGSDDGFVYRLDSGAGFDAGELDALLRLTFNNLGSPTTNKRFHKATAEVRARPAATLYFTADFSYGDPDLSSIAEQAFSVDGGGGFWNEADWNEFYWSSRVEGLAEAHIDGAGTSISIAVSTRATYEQPHTIHGLTLHYSPRGLAR
jgi:hypothetical protein